MNRMCQNCPRIEVPASLQASETGTWTHFSVVKRLPDVGQRLLKENNFPEDIAGRVQQLIDEIPLGAIRYLEDENAPDFDQWNQIIQPYAGKNWLDVPWLFVEFYFYRRVLEATGYFVQNMNLGMDPYIFQKEQGLLISEQAIIDLCRKVDDWKDEGIPVWKRLEKLFKVSLWGNQLDLSIWPADGEPANQHATDEDNQSHIVVDDSAEVIRYLERRHAEETRIDMILDNAGFELICDLMMADFFLQENLAASVKFHLKSMPTYVSDTMICDVDKTIAYCLSNPHREIKEFGERIQNHLRQKRLILSDHLFWTSSQRFWDLPDDLKNDLEGSSLLIFKGDANFRRLLGDAHWPYSTRFSDITCYFSVPVLSLRIYKSEVAAGIPAEKQEMLDKNESDWSYNGQWGMLLWYDGIS